MKYLQVVDGELFLVANESAFPVGDNRIIGPLRRVERVTELDLTNAPRDAGAEVNTVPGSYVSDPTFSRATSVWTSANNDPDRFNFHWAKTDANSQASIVQGAGFGGGNVLRLEESNNGLATVWNIAKAGFNDGIGNEDFLIQARFRKRDSTTLGLATQLVFDVAVIADDSHIGNPQTVGHQFTNTDINGWAVDAWQTISFSASLSSISDESNPYIGVAVAWEWIESMRIDIDFLRIVGFYVPSP